jgi:hypothetical protein
VWIPEEFREVARDAVTIAPRGSALCHQGMQKGAATGPSGWSSDLLRLLRHKDGALGSLAEGASAALADLLSCVACGDMPQGLTRLLAAADLVPLSKGANAQEGDVRPIAVGEVHRRLLAKILARKVAQKAAEHLAPLNLAVGVAGGCEQIIKGVTMLLQSGAQRDAAVLCLDFANAFNSVSRVHLLRELEAHFPELVPYFECFYRCPRSCASSANPGSPAILSREGVQQGDGLGTLFFCVAGQAHPPAAAGCPAR